MGFLCLYLAWKVFSICPSLVSCSSNETVGFLTSKCKPVTSGKISLHVRLKILASKLGALEDYICKWTNSKSLYSNCCVCLITISTIDLRKSWEYGKQSGHLGDGLRFTSNTTQAQAPGQDRVSFIQTYQGISFV